MEQFIHFWVNNSAAILGIAMFVFSLILVKSVKKGEKNLNKKLFICCLGFIVMDICAIATLLFSIFINYTGLFDFAVRIVTLNVFVIMLVFLIAFEFMLKIRKGKENEDTGETT